MEIDTIKISELAEGTTINNDSILVYNLNGQTKKITFQNLKNAVISALASEVSQLDADLDAEVSARTAADTALAGDISAEATARANADTSLGGDITAEAEARAAADTTLAGDITAEAEARTAADTAIINTLINKDAAAPFAEQPALTLDNCTGTLTNELYYNVVENTLAIYGRFRIANIGRTSSSPGVKLSLPSGYQITTPTPANHQIYLGSSFYSDAVRNGESTFLQLINGSHDYFYVRASESFANIIDNKTIMYIVPYTLLKLSSN